MKNFKNFVKEQNLNDFEEDALKEKGIVSNSKQTLLLSTP